MVDAGEFGSGGKGEHLEASEVDLAATTTALLSVLWLLDGGGGCYVHLRSRLLLGRWRFVDRCLVKRRRRVRLVCWTLAWWRERIA